MNRLLDALTGRDSSTATREAFRQRFTDGHLNETEIEIELEAAPQMPFEIPGGGQVGMINLGEMMGKAFGQGQMKRRKLTVPSAWDKLVEEEADKRLDQVAGNLFDVAADIADLGELGRLDLHERRVGELGEAAADLGLAAAGGPDHQDVLGRDLVAQLGREALAPPAVPQRDRDRALGVVLSNDVLIERGDDRLGGKAFQ